mgnify:CR=1 FL=1
MVSLFILLLRPAPPSNFRSLGNPFFAVQFLQMLQNDRFLYFSRDTFVWTWDTETIQSETSITDNVVDLIANSLRMLPLKTQNFLMVASCLGTRFDVSTVWTVFLCLKEDYTSEDNESGVSENVSDILQPAVKEGLSKAGLEPQIMVDFSHANSSKQHQRQIDVANDIAGQISNGSRSIFGVMVESHINGGAQKFTPGVDSLSGLEYGKSITDACINWDDSVAVLETLSNAVKVRRNK